MALFKISKGSQANLDKQKKSQGYVWVTEDEHAMYVDMSDTERVKLYDYLDTDVDYLKTTIEKKTNTSVMPNDSGDIKTKYRIAQKGNTGDAVWYYKICDLPINNTGNYASAVISGRIGGWTSSTISSINALVYNSGTPGIALWDITGAASNMSSVWNAADLVLYVNSTTGTTAAATATLYIKCSGSFVFDLDLELFQNTANISFDGTYLTTTPTGTLATKSSTTSQRVELVNNNLLVNGTSVVLTNKGNAGTATTLKDAREINGTRFDGSQNITTEHWGTARTFTIKDSSTHYGTGVSVNGSKDVTLVLPSEINASVTSAGAFTEAADINLTGDVTGTSSSKKGWTITTTLASSGVTAGEYGPPSNVSPGVSGTFKVPYFSVDSKGRITAASTKTITLPTDTKVTNTLATTTKAYLTGTTSSTTNTGTQIFDTGVYLGTTAGELVATTFTGALNGNATSATTAATANAVAWSNVTSKPSYYDAKAIKSITRSGTTFTYTCLDGTTGTFTQQDNNTTYTSLKNPYSLTIQGNGTSLGSYDGSAAKTINITYSNVGAAPVSHTHSYIPLSGGTMSSSGAQIQRPGSSVTWINGRANAFIRISSYSGYNSIYSLKTTDGDWSCGVYSNNRLFWTYCTDTNYNAGTNSTTSQMSLTPEGYLTATRVYNAVWNDYAEFRKAETIEPGRVVIENCSGEMKLSTKRLQPGASIISDTFGHAMGETDENKTPLAVAGRVLAYPYEDRHTYPLGAAVCSGPNGTVSLMTREEIMTYPERIVGTVSEIPEYETWGEDNIKVSGRIWIKVR